MKDVTLALCRYLTSDTEELKRINLQKLDAEIEKAQSSLEELNQKVAALQQENASLKQDVDRLDWLDTQVKRHVVYNGYAWQEAGYESDRGLVCMIQGKRDRMSARQAIDTAMQSNNQ